MPCPRCQAEVDPCARVCPACALPLALGDEPAPVPLARMILLDRRGPGRAASVLPDSSAHLERAGSKRSDLDLHRDPDLDRELDPAPSVLPQPSGFDRSAACAQDRLRAGGAESKGAVAASRVPPDRAAASAALHLLASVALDVLLVVAAAAVPLAVASSGGAAAPGALAALAVPAAGFVALVAAAYVLLSRALLGATPGRLAVARAARGGPSGSARGHPTDVRAP